MKVTPLRSQDLGQALKMERLRVEMSTDQARWASRLCSISKLSSPLTTILAPKLFKYSFSKIICKGLSRQEDVVIIERRSIGRSRLKSGINSSGHKTYGKVWDMALNSSRRLWAYSAVTIPWSKTSFLPESGKGVIAFPYVGVAAVSLEWLEMASDINDSDNRCAASSAVRLLRVCSNCSTRLTTWRWISNK